LGAVDNPFIIATKGEIWDTVDERFFKILDVFRWVKCGMMKLDVEKDPYWLCAGVRAMMECSNG